VSRSARRRRGALLIALALAAGGLASSRVERREQGIEARVGPPVPVVVATADLRQGQRIGPKQTRALAVREVPARFAPPDALADPGDAVGATLAAPVAAGGYLTAGALAAPAGDDEPGGTLAPGQRAVEVAVAGGEELAGAGPGALVDVVVTTEREEGRGRTYLALERVELLAARPAADGAAAEDGRPAAVATLRVTLRQAVYLAAAQTFAREIRLLLRAPAERRRGAPLVVESGSL
jgi:pilus assembly protein CpaB